VQQSSPSKSLVENRSPKDMTTLAEVAIEQTPENSMR